MERMERVNQMMRREVSLIIQQELGDPRLALMSISRVEVSRDLQHAKVFFSVFGDEKKIEQTQQALDKAKGFIRGCVAQRISLKFIPQLNFFYDKSLDYQMQMENEIERLHDEFPNNP